MGKQEKKFKLSKESATAEFNKMVEEFNFSISTEVKERIVTMKVNNVDMQSSSEMADADAFIDKIMTGRIRFDEDKKKIVVVLKDPVYTGNDNSIRTDEISFGKFTRVTQKSIKWENEKGKRVPVSLNEINFGTMPDEMADAVLQAMTGISDIRILQEIDIPTYNDLRMVAGYFFS